jgi:hypothetical protein
MVEGTAMRSLQARKGVVLQRLRVLEAEEESILENLSDLRERMAKALQELEHVERESRPKRSVTPEEEWRRTVRQLGVFVTSELATELGCSGITAKKHINEMMEAGIVRPAGKVFGKPAYEYVKPTDAGEKFEAQRKHQLHAVESVATAAPKRGTVMGVSKGGGAEPIPNKDIRKAVAAAIRNGWDLERKGDGHWKLTKPGLPSVSVAGTPSNPTGTADMIRRLTGVKRAS